MSGGDNLYLLHYAGGEWSTTFIATLSHEDEKSWYEPPFGDGPQENLTGVSSRVSPDGRFLAFMSDRSLTGYDNLDANSGQPDEEVYLYDAASGRLVCASCNPTGARPVGIHESSGSILLVDRYSSWENSGWLGIFRAGIIVNAKWGCISRAICPMMAVCSFNSEMRWCRRIRMGSRMCMSMSRGGYGMAASDNCTTASSATLVNAPTGV